MSSYDNKERMNKALDSYVTLSICVYIKVFNLSSLKYKFLNVTLKYIIKKIKMRAIVKLDKICEKLSGMKIFQLSLSINKNIWLCNKGFKGIVLSILIVSKNGLFLFDSLARNLANFHEVTLKFATIWQMCTSVCIYAKYMCTFNAINSVESKLRSKWLHFIIFLF